MWAINKKVEFIKTIKEEGSGLLKEVPTQGTLLDWGSLASNCYNASYQTGIVMEEDGQLSQVEIWKIKILER